MRATQRFAQDFIDETELIETLRRDAHGLGRDFFLVGTLPENRRATLRRDDRVDGVLQHDQPVATPMASAPPEPPSPMTARDDGHAQRRHLEQVAGDGLALVAFLRADAGIGPGRVDERNDRQAEALGHAHEPQRLAIALGLGHAVVAPDPLLGVATLLVADEHDRHAGQPRNATDDGLVVGIHAIAVQLVEFIEDRHGIVERVRSLRMTRKLCNLPGRQVGENAAVSARLLARRRAISSPMLTSASEETKRNSSIFASSSAIGCSKSRKLNGIGRAGCRTRRLGANASPSAWIRQPLPKHWFLTAVHRQRRHHDAARSEGLDRRDAVSRSMGTPAATSLSRPQGWGYGVPAHDSGMPGPAAEA